ncbi:MAG: ABC transporter permease [Burkholderiaceae bacterium]
MNATADGPSPDHDRGVPPGHPGHGARDAASADLDGAAPSARVLIWMAQAAWRQQPGTLIVAMLAIALGVALASGVHAVNRSALVAFAGALATVNGQADLRLGAALGNITDGRLEAVEAMPEVRAAAPVIESALRVLGPDTAAIELRLIAIDPLRAAAIQPQLAAALADRNRPVDALASDRVALSPGAMRALAVQPGQSITVLTPAGPLPMTVAGQAPGATADDRLAVMDIATAQWRLQMTGELTGIDLRLREGVDPRAFARLLGEREPALMPMSSDTEHARMSNLSRAYRVNLNVLALVALLTGGFIVQAAMRLCVARLASSLALLGLLGAPRSFGARALHGLALALGVLGSALGLLGGLALAGLLLRLVGGDLGGGYFASERVPLRPDALALAGFGLLGIVASLAGTWAPARRLGDIAPMRTLRGGLIDPRPRLARSLFTTATLAACALGLLWVPAIDGLPWAAYASMGCALLAGISVIGPLLAGLARRLERGLAAAWHWPPGWLAIARLADQPGAAAVALSGVVASFALVTAMGVMVHSFRGSVDQWLQAVLPADLYLRARVSGTAGAFDADAQRALAGRAGVGEIRFLRTRELSITPGQAPITLIGRDVDVRQPERALPLTGPALAPEADTGDCLRVFASEPAEIRLGWATGQRIELPLPGQPCAVVAGVWRDYARQHGALALSRSDYRRLTGDDTVSDAAITLEPGASAAAVIEAAQQRLGARIDLQARSAGEIRALSLGIFDRSFALTHALEGVALLVGLFGVVTTFAGEAQARLREFGLLRHLGFTRRQITLQFACEASIAIGAGVALGTALGALLAQVLIHRVNPQSFHWRMSTDWPIPSLLVSAALLILVGVIGAALATRRAAGQAPILAVRADW